jgi:predicted ATPase/DNA-binding CsgD family transcriptional regulator
MPGDLAHNLPAPRTTLIGRERDVTECCQLIIGSTYRLLTLTGVGGCGKTCLALRVASELRDAFPDGVWLVELAAISDESLVPQVVASTLGVLDSAGTSALDVLVAFLRPRAALLVLDNCEHLVDACAALADRLLATCPDLRILATSRELLQIDGERQRRVLPLTIPDPRDFSSPEALAHCPSVQLFVERARAIEPTFQLTAANAPAVARVCTSLDGIPLALELAAARVRVLSVEQIQERLGDCLRLLTGSSRAKPTRQQTLRSALTWSYDLLTESEQVAFRRLAVFGRGWGLEAAETVCGGPGVLDLLTRLVDKSLVLVGEVEHAARYRLLEPVRQYAWQRLEASGEANAARARHLGFFVALAERAATFLRGPEQVAWLTRLEQEQDNLRAALRWAEEGGDGESLTRLAGALAPFWEGHSHVNEARRWLDAALDPSWNVPVTTSARAKALLGAGRMAFLAGDYDKAVGRFAESLGLADQLGIRAGAAAALVDLGMALRLQRNVPRSVQVLEEGLALYRELGDRAGIALALLNLGATLRIQGAVDRSRILLEDSLSLFRDEGDVRCIAITQAMLGHTALQQGDARLAAVRFTEGLAGCVEAGDRWFVVYDLMGLAAALVGSGKVARAARLLGAARAIGDAPGNPLVNVGRITYGSLVEDVRARLSEEEFARVWAEGQAMSFDQAVRYALAADEPDPAPAQVIPPPALRGAAGLLTAREREVARLIGQGVRTDRQIAERLTITVGTAGVHVHHILEKLGLHSRWQIADWAIAQGLAEQNPHS